MLCRSKALIYNSKVSHIKSQINYHLLFMPGTLRPYQRQIKKYAYSTPDLSKAYTYTYSFNCCSEKHTRLSTVVRQMRLIYYIVKWQTQFRVRRTWMCQSFAMRTITKTRRLWRESEDIRFLFTSMRSVIRSFESKFLIILIILLA